MSFLNRSVGQIATDTPGATAVFFQHKINFCCDGDVPLIDVVERKSIDQASIIAALEAVSVRGEHSLDVDNLSTPELIEHILQRFHIVHREQLVELQRLAQRVEFVHIDHPRCPTGLSQHLATMQAELETHMQKEERILFPMLARGHSPMADGPISVMRFEHDDHMEQIRKIYELTNDVMLFEGACNTWQALYIGLQAFISDLHRHIYLENNILFARA